MRTSVEEENECFVSLFQSVFDHAPEGKEVSEQLLSVQQDKRQAAKYVLEFCTLAAKSSWNEPTLKAVICHRFNNNVHKEMACRVNEATVDTLRPGNQTQQPDP